MRDLRAALRPENLPGVFVAVVAGFLGTLVVASAADYVSLAQAHTLPSFAVVRRIEFVGTEGSGALAENGSVGFTLLLRVDNPSRRVLAFEQVAYKAWIEDGPMEAGLSNLGRTDDLLVNQTGTHWFYLAFLGSQELTGNRIPAGGNGSVSLAFTLAKSNDSVRFEAVRNITVYSVARGRSPSTIPWNVWVLVSLQIDGVPAPTSPTAADYLRQTTRVVLQEGLNLGG